MQNDNIIGIRRGNMFTAYFIAFIIVIIILALLHYLEILSFEKLINPVSLIPISIFVIFFLLSFLKYIDKRPLIIINSSGLSLRKSRLPFSALEQIDWNDIKDYSAQVNQFRHGVTKFLIIKRKSTDKKYYVDLFDLKTDDAVVLTAINKYLKGIPI